MASLPAEALDLYGSDAGEFSPPPHAKNLSRPRHRQIFRHLSSKLIALLGLALFGCAMMVAFRVVSLDAAQQLQQPAIDFALCGAVGFLGLSISWVHLGNRPGAEITKTFEYGDPATSESMAPATASPSTAVTRCTSQMPSPASPAVSTSGMPAHKQKRGVWPGTRLCPFCGQKMAHVAPAQYQCRICRHLENRAPLSFLDSETGCSCTHCRQNLPHAG